MRHVFFILTGLLFSTAVLAEPDYSISQKALDTIPRTDRAVYIPECSKTRKAISCAEDAFTLFSDYHYVFAGDDDTYPLNFFIRHKNYSVFDELTSASADDKKKFIDLYMKTTGFPDLAAVSKKIEENFYAAVKRTETLLNTDGDKYKVLFAGFSPASYWGAKASFPGDELENAYVIINGANGDDKNMEIAIAQTFRDVLFSNLDNRLISSRRVLLSFAPHITTKKQLFDYLNEADTATRELLKNGKEDVYKKLKYNTVSDVTDIAKVSQFNADVRNVIGASPVRLWNLAFILEPLSFHPLMNGQGKLTSEQAEIKDRLKASPFYDLTNIFVLNGTMKKKALFENKTVVKNRRELAKTFAQKNIDEQYEIVRELVKYPSDDGAYDIILKYTRDVDMPSVFRSRGARFFKRKDAVRIADIDEEAKKILPKNRLKPFSDTLTPMAPADRAIAAYDLLADSRYFMTPDKMSFPVNRLIAAKNYEVISSLQTTVDKKRFINYYKKVTGFPNLAAVSKRISDYFNRFTKEMSDRLNTDEKTDAYTIVLRGYSPVCSVAYDVALPGSDLDGGYVLLKGTGDIAKDREIVQKYLNNYIEKIDQRLITVSTDIYTLPYVRTTTMFLNELSCYDNIVQKFMTPEKREKYLRMKAEAPQYFQSSFSYQGFLDDMMTEMSSVEEKDAFFEFLHVAEPMYANVTGAAKDTFKTAEQRDFVNSILKSDTMALSNLYLISSTLKKVQSGDLKSKLENRMALSRDFNGWSVNKQFELVCALIKLPTAEDKPLSLLAYTENDVLIGRYLKVFETLWRVK